ncbi:hypothetical protein JVU11DRAFT_7329 [Chiua virens]|nr:hypothetical protein JVU11DRAFT_7329 [Chiua virens]
MSLISADANGKQRAPPSALNLASSALYALSQSLSSLPQTPTPPKQKVLGTRTGLRSSTAAAGKDSPTQDGSGSVGPGGHDGIHGSGGPGPSGTISGSGGVKKSSLKILKRCAIFVDVRTDDAGSLFVDMLKGLGAKIMGRLGRSCMHIVYKNGHPNTLIRYRLLDGPKPAVVGIAWVVECVEKRRLDEEKFKVNVDMINVAGGSHKRRRSMVPKHLIPASPGPDYEIPTHMSSEVDDDDEADMDGSPYIVVSSSPLGLTKRNMPDQWKPGTVEAAVDQRALVNKVLARYAGQFDLFRELLQNSDDANSSTVEIHFETSTYRDCGEENQDVLTVLKSESVSHWTIKNNGDKFSDNDWERLRTIASGNPDPQKIGAFGVGFYVVFSKTESPIVSSGGRAMKFHWGTSQLLLADCSVVTDDSWTVFDLPLREPARVPPLLELMRFLATSITFMVNLRVVRVSYNRHVMGCIEKSTSVVQKIPAVPQINEDFMTIQEIQQYSITIQAKIKAIVYTTIGSRDTQAMTALESCDQQILRDYMQEYKSTVDLMVFTADVNAAVPTGVSKSCLLEVPGSQEAYASFVLRLPPTRFCASQERQSLIFIGHATAQSTGLGGHIMSRFIPTVERELIDLGDGAASKWNRELLHVGGLLCRAIYEWELSDIQQSWSRDESATVTGAHIIETLPDQHRVRKITLMEVFKYLREHNLTSQEMASCIRWWMGLDVGDQASSKDILMDSASFKCINGSELRLSSIRYFIDPQGPWARITLDGPLPETLLPCDISQDFTRTMLEKLGWKEFTIIPWLEHLLDPSTMSANPDHDFTKSRDWAERVLDISAGLWASSSDKMRHNVKAMLQTEHCIPTAESLSPPGRTYLPDANHHLVGDFYLPVVQFNKVPIDTRTRNFLSFIGVQTHTPLKLVWERQVDQGKWSVCDFIHYVVQRPPTPSDLHELKESVIFPNEGTEKKSTPCRYRADGLYPPLDEFRGLKLRVVDWGQPQWRDESDEAKVMGTAFEYLCANLGSQYSDFGPNDFREQAFIPGEIEGEDKTSLRRPGELFLDSEWKDLGFAVVPDRYRDIPLSRFGVQKDPPSSMLIRSLPPKREIALKWLQVLSKHVSSFTQTELKELSELKIVPTGLSGRQELRPPKKCYLGKPSKFYSSIFNFVDFDPDVIHFLRTCGSKDGPSITDIADALIADPQRFYDLAGKDRFLAELRQLAHNNHLSPATMYDLCSKPTLLGEKRERADSQGQWKYHHELQKPEDIVIADDDNYYQLFADCMFVAPRDDELLQGFYKSFGCERLNKLVHPQRRREDLEETSDPETWTQMEVRDLIQQRLPLFLQKCTHARPDIDWLPDFKVRVWKTLSAQEVFRLRKRDPIIRQQDVWAIMPVEYGESGQVELWLSASAPKDMYQLATCLCRRLFETAKDKDTFFLESILSADPEVLEGRGFIVQPTDTAHQVNEGKKGHPASKVTPSLARVATQTSPDRITTCINPAEGGGAVTEILTRSLHAFGDTVSGVLREGVMPWKTKNSTQLITRDDIRNKITAAIAACHARNEKSLDGSPATTQFHNNYCEVERPGEVLKFSRRVAGIEIHLPQGGYRMDLARHESLGRFIQIITPIARVYGLSNESLRIFSDNTPGRIAFNREKRLYVNLLHFETWHDHAVANGDRQQCQVSWFLTLAHEIAHNINRFHNAEHEFWFSEICEAYFISFARDVLSK